MATITTTPEVPIAAPELEIPGERPFTPLPGMPMLLVGVFLLLGLPALIFLADLPPVLILVTVIVAVFWLSGLFTIDPNQARVMIFFGDYGGRCAATGSSGPTRS